MNNFKYVLVLLDLLYNIEIEEEEAEELGLLGWNLIGNKNIKFYRYKAKIDPKDLSVTLPCNAVLNNGGDTCIELVTTGYEDWESVTNKTNFGDLSSSIIEESIEAQKYYQSPYYMPGKMLKYHQVGDKLYFTHNYGTVNILYKGVLVDENGLPELTDKEATAIATYIAYIVKFKEGLITNNTNIINMSNLLKAQWLQQCDQARITYLNQNDMNNILEIKNSWDRANYNKSFKVIR